MKKLLLIDDEEGIRTVWKRFHDIAEPVFRGELEMDVASDLAQGIEKIQAEKPGYDAIVLDLKFKGAGSDDTITWIAGNANSLPPIIIMTGDPDIFVRRRCMMFGAADFWLKSDAAERPDLFFKAVYNQYLKRYDTNRLNAA